MKDRAFFNESRNKEDLAEELGEEVVNAMTTGEDQEQAQLDAEVEGERGGPFVETTGSEEFADDVDESNPVDATREPFPKL